MIENRSGFAKYSKNLCWVVAIIATLLAVISFAGGSEGSMVNGILWLALAIAFGISANFLSRSQQNQAGSASTANTDSNNSTEQASE